jgi:hypothetical protein
MIFLLQLNHLLINISFVGEILQCGDFVILIVGIGIDQFPSSGWQSHIFDMAAPENQGAAIVDVESYFFRPTNS